MSSGNCCPNPQGMGNGNGDITIAGVGPAVNSQFDELKVSERTPIFEISSTYGISALRDVISTTGTGTVTNNTVVYEVATGTGSAGAASLETAQRGRYQPGYAAEAGIAVRVPQLPTGSQIGRWGLFGIENGLFFGVSGNEGVFVGVRRDGVETRIQQNDWNIDPLNGTGPSGLTLDLNDGNIFQIDFTWYGFGVIEWSVVMQNQQTLAQEVVTVHRYKPISFTSLEDPNLPVKAEVQNNGETTSFLIRVAGRQYSILGENVPSFRVTSARRTVTATTTLTPLLSFQRKAEFPAGSGRPNSINVTLEGLDLVTGADIFYQIVLGGTLNTAFSDFPTANTNIPATETALRVNNTATSFSTPGQVVFQGLAVGGQGNQTNLTEGNLLDIVLPSTSIITLAVGTFSGSTTVQGVFRASEEW
ncbi:hypothetical protein [Alkalibacillus haloalkaliphilus]|uniref:Uncharacterized protein n=1 Tax=Alkalibacillus haloalkaliphilus TaxID=94136 RepID=A0A511W740_9BACI|nr:hypothetical protein [Alkalibacillus haloalkaliphilus]GEN46856.1 hypothetical protein AHA02nite_26320 [Alkalibacillus haloalkaliphilus]